MATDRRCISLGVLIPIVCGAALLAGAAFLAVPRIIFVAGAARTQAVFVGSEARPGGPHGGTFNHASFRFEVNDGPSVVVTSRFGSSDQPYADGDTVSVLYDPRNPTHAEIDSTLEIWLTPLFLAIIGAGLTGIPTLVLFASRRAPPA